MLLSSNLEDFEKKKEINDRLGIIETTFPKKNHEHCLIKYKYIQQNQFEKVWKSIKQMGEVISTAYVNGPSNNLSEIIESNTLTNYTIHKGDLWIKITTENNTPETIQMHIRGLFNIPKSSNDEKIKIQKNRIKMVRNFAKTNIDRLKQQFSPLEETPFRGINSEIYLEEYQDAIRINIKYFGFGFKGQTASIGPVDLDSPIPNIGLAKLQINLIRDYFVHLISGIHPEDLGDDQNTKKMSSMYNQIPKKDLNSSEVYIGNSPEKILSRQWYDLNGDNKSSIGNDQKSIYISGITQENEDSIISKIKNGKNGDSLNIEILSKSDNKEGILYRLSEVQQRIHELNITHQSNQLDTNEIVGLTRAYHLPNTLNQTLNKEELRAKSNVKKTLENISEEIHQNEYMP